MDQIDVFNYLRVPSMDQIDLFSYLRVPSMDQIELFNHLLYLKSFNKRLIFNRVMSVK